MSVVGFARPALNEFLLFLWGNEDYNGNGGNQCDCSSKNCSYIRPCCVDSLHKWQCLLRKFKCTNFLEPSLILAKICDKLTSVEEYVSEMYSYIVKISLSK